MKLKCNKEKPLAYNVVNTYAGGIFMGRKVGSKGIMFVSLGLGLLISLVLPEKIIIILLAIALGICGFALCKS